MHTTWIITLFFLGVTLFTHAQSDTINRRDDKGMKQGYWIYYGIDRPSLGYADSARIMEGRFVDDKREGKWIMYDRSGWVKKEVEAKEGRIYGQYTEYDSLGRIRERGAIQPEYLYSRRSNLRPPLRIYLEYDSLKNVVAVHEYKRNRSFRDSLVIYKAAVYYFSLSPLSNFSSTGDVQLMDGGEDVHVLGKLEDGWLMEGEFRYYIGGVRTYYFEEGYRRLRFKR